jgi:hypothetical protein
MEIFPPALLLLPRVRASPAPVTVDRGPPVAGQEVLVSCSGRYGRRRPRRRKVAGVAFGIYITDSTADAYRRRLRRNRREMVWIKEMTVVEYKGSGSGGVRQWIEKRITEEREKVAVVVGSGGAGRGRHRRTREEEELSVKMKIRWW